MSKIEKESIIDNLIKLIESEENKEHPSIFVVDKFSPILKKTKEFSEDKFKKLYDYIISIYNKNIIKDDNALLKVNHLR